MAPWCSLSRSRVNLPGRGLADEMRRHLALRKAQLAEYTDIERRDFPPGRVTDEDRLRHLVLRAGIELETFWTQWLREALAEDGTMDPA